MVERRWNESRFYQADNGEWFEVKGHQQPGRVLGKPSFESVDDQSFLTFKEIECLQSASIDKSGRFACMEGICEMGGAGTSDRSGRFACMEGVCEMGGVGTGDRNGRFACMEGICEN